MNEHVTLLHPDARDPTARGVSSGFPVDLLSQSAGRLRVLALLYAFVFFMAGIVPALLLPGERARFLGSFLRSEEHTSELQSQSNLVCRLLLEKKKSQPRGIATHHH